MTRKSIRHVLLLRGVNVGGHRKLAMASLRDGLTNAGCSHVVTYIQSGNIVLTPPRLGPVDVASWAGRVVSDIAGFEVNVVVRTAAELTDTVHASPYPDADPTTLHVVFFDRAPDQLRALDPARFGPERFALVGRDLYLQLPNGLGRAALPAAMDALVRKLDPPVVITVRNWRTIGKLIELARSPPS